MSARRPTYLRFVAMESHAASGSRAGIFTVVYMLRDDPDTLPYDQARLSELIGWFKTYLKVPNRFSRHDPKKDQDKPRRGIAWFKDSATDHLAKIRELIAIVEDYGHEIEQVTTKHPGFIVYEDGEQIVAEPFADKRR